MQTLKYFLFVVEMVNMLKSRQLQTLGEVFNGQWSMFDHIGIGRQFGVNHHSMYIFDSTGRSTLVLPFPLIVQMVAEKNHQKNYLYFLKG